MTDSVTVYGIANCDTVKKARKWLTAQSVSHEFHDYKKKGIDAQSLNRWCDELGWEPLVNKRGTTWRKLDDSLKQDLSRDRAIELMMEHTSLIKRPVIDAGGKLLLGFDEAAYTTTFAGGS